MGFISTTPETLFTSQGDSHPGLRDWECDVDGWERSRETSMRKCGPRSLRDEERQHPDQISFNSFKMS
jgi:hypothetical protein